MTDSVATVMAVIFGVAVFAVILVIGWRSVQNRRIVRLQGADGQETIIVADEDDKITSVVTTAETTISSPVADLSTSSTDPAATPDFGRKGETAI